MKNVAIFDLDGCLSDDAWRLNLVANAKVPSDYDEYNRRCSADKFIKKNEGTLRRFVNAKEFTVAFLTARPESVRQKTVEWLRLRADLAPGDYMLVMRPEGCVKRSPQLKGEFMQEMQANGYYIAAAFDDRKDVLDAYAALGLKSCYVMNREGHHPHKPKSTQDDTASILQEMADTFKERNSVYRDNYKMIAPMVKALFPNGVPPELVVTDQWHLFELKLVKMARFAASGLTHADSMHDDAVYSAMIESILRQGEVK